MHPALQYCRDVLAGRIVACRYVRLACERHMHDLAHGRERGLRFSPLAAQHAIDFVHTFCRHVKGRWAKEYDDQHRPRDTRIQLTPASQFFFWCLFGWMRQTPDGWRRRFRTCYKEVARKNAKTTEAAAIGLYLFWADEEPGCECYTTATTRDQAKLCHNLAVKMVEKDPDLSREIDYFRGVSTLAIDATASSFTPLSADHNTLDGLNIHGAICDEVHEWRGEKGRGMWEVIETATGSRDQSLQVAITTAGYDRQSICYDLREYAAKVLKGFNHPDGVKDDSFFALIYTIDRAQDWPDLVPIDAPADRRGVREDDWKDPACWIKANPNLGISKDIDTMMQQRDKALAMPTAVNGFLRKHLDVWVSQASRWIPMELWDQNNTGEVYVRNGGDL
ncbi:MAG: terminase large subunit [Smithellaceae bacterium]